MTTNVTLRRQFMMAAQALVHTNQPTVQHIDDVIKTLEFLLNDIVALPVRVVLEHTTRQPIEPAVTYPSTQEREAMFFSTPQADAQQKPE